MPHGFSFKRYSRYDTCVGMNQIITAFSKLSERYISECSGQKNKSYQTKRMAKWRDILSKEKGLKLFFQLYFASDIYLWHQTCHIFCVTERYVTWVICNKIHCYGFQTFISLHISAALPIFFITGRCLICLLDYFYFWICSV